MKRGRKALPPATHAARGTVSQVPGGVEVLPTAGGLVQRPDGMSLAAQMVWDDFADRAMAMGTLKPADALLFAQWCQMSADIQASWAPGNAPAPAAFIAQWRQIAELFGLAGEKSRVVLKVVDADPAGNANPFARNGRR